MHTSRKLAAILFADIVGYTALMQKDEAIANKSLEKFHSTLKEEVLLYNGQIINNYGDGCVCTFDSAVDAMSCAKAVQSIFQEDPIIPVRMGLHSGDVFFKDNNVYGDSVNIASRIESLGIAGSILFSKQIKRHISNHSEFEVKSLGEFHFKNVEKDMEVLALTNDGFAIPSSTDIQGKTEKKTLPRKNTQKWLNIAAGIFALLVAGYLLYNNNVSSTSITSEKIDKTIAILPFRDLSPNQDQVYFADGIVEAIRSKLAQVGDLKVTSMTSVLGYRENPKPVSVIAQELNVRHLLEGTIFRDKNKVRIIAQLIDTKTDEHLWAETYDEEMDDIFEIQSKIANIVTTELQAKLTPQEVTQLKQNISSDINAYDILLSGENEFQEFKRSRRVSLILSAEEQFNAALKIDPQLDQAYLGIANCWFEKYELGMSLNALDSATYFLDKCIDLNEYNDGAFALKSKICYYNGDHESSKMNAQKALKLSPNNVEAMVRLAYHYGQIEKMPEKQIPLLLKAIALDPTNSSSKDRNTLTTLANLAEIYDDADMSIEAEKLLRKALRLSPSSPRNHANMSYFLYTRERFEEAIKYRLQFLELIGMENASFDNIDATAWIYFLAGKYEEAKKYYEINISKIDSGLYENKNHHIWRHRYAFILDRMGDKEKAQKIFEEHIERCKREYNNSEYSNSFAYDLANTYAHLGDKEQALEWIEKIEYKTWLHKFMKIDPLFDNIRGEDRFKKKIAEGEEQVRRSRNTLKSLEVDGRLIIPTN